MSEFQYDARDASGRAVSGRISAANRGEAFSALRGQGLLPWRLTGGQPATGAPNPASNPGPTAGSRAITDTLGSKAATSTFIDAFILALQSPIQLNRKPPVRQLSAVIRQLAGLLHAGMALDRALYLLGRMPRSKSITNLILDAYAQVRQGRPLSQALMSPLASFPPYAYSMIQAGEAAGDLDGALLAVADILDRNGELRALIRTSLAYPLFMLGVSCVAVIILMTFVVPRFLGIFEMWGGELPTPTRILVQGSRFVQTWGAPLGVICVAAVSFLSLWIARPNGRLVWDGWMLRLPVVGPAIRDAASARLVRTLGVMLQGGVGLATALQVAEEVLGNARLAQGMKTTADRVKDGADLSAVWRELRLFPPVAVELVAMGEEAGDLPYVLRQSADLLEGEIRQRVKYLTALFEPVLILLMALVIGFIVLSILLPVVSLTSFPT